MEANEIAKEQESNKPGLLKLFLTCLKIGTFTFGGGYAMIALIQDEFVTNQKWLDNEDMLNIIAVAQSVPGVIAVNSSIMVGYKVRKVKGALVCALGVVLPSLISLCIISSFYLQFRDNKYVVGALRGVKAAVVALMCSAILKIARPSVKDVFTGILCAIAFVIAFFTDINAIILILAGGVIGYVYYRRKNRAD